jgi:hypothetical protein
MAACAATARPGHGLELPHPFGMWAEQIVGSGEVPSPQVDCRNCSMSQATGNDPAERFSPTLKCCTYVPTLPNFSVGFLLADDSDSGAAGRQSIRNRISTRIALTPLGLGVSKPIRLLYQYATRKNHRGFGRLDTIACPHYLQESGTCGIWRYREATCATWFCKFERGAVGFDFWRRALHALLTTVEVILVRHCVLELGLEVRSLEQLYPWTRSEDDGGDRQGHQLEPPSKALHAANWGNFLGKEEAFFASCAELVNSLSWTDVTSIGGSELRLRREMLQRSLSAAAGDGSPSRVRSTKLTVISNDGQKSLVSGYSALDPILIDNPILQRLHKFNDGAAADVAIAIERETGLGVDLRKLLDFGILRTTG